MVLGLALAAGAIRPSAQQQQPPQPPDAPRFESSAGVTIVSVDVVVRDAAGNVVRGLTAKDFVVSEDGKPQTLSTFSFQEISEATPAGTPDIQLLDGLEDKVRAEAARAASASSPATAPTAAPGDTTSLNNRRMLTIVFDVSSMQPEDVQRAVDSATKYVNQTMSPADMVAVATVSSMLDVLTDFTGDKTKVVPVLRIFSYACSRRVNA